MSLSMEEVGRMPRRYAATVYIEIINVASILFQRFIKEPSMKRQGNIIVMEGTLVEKQEVFIG